MTSANIQILQIYALLDFLMFNALRTFITSIAAAITIWSLYGPHAGLVIAYVVSLNSLIIHRVDQVLKLIDAKGTYSRRKAVLQQMAL